MPDKSVTAMTLDLLRAEWTKPLADANASALAILNEAMGDPECVDWPDDARTYIARAAAALEAR